jgi:hypothetical protein
MTPEGREAGLPPDAVDERLRERLVSSEVLRKSRVLEFRIDTVEAADGHR